MKAYTRTEFLSAFPIDINPQPGKFVAKTGLSGDIKDLNSRIIKGEAYHQPLVSMAWRYSQSNMPAPFIVQALQGVMLSVPDDIKNSHPDRWQARYNDIARIVETAQKKLAIENNQAGNLIDVSSSPHMQATLDTINQIGKENSIFSMSSLYRWRGDGKWSKIEDREIKKIIHAVASSLKLTKSTVDSIIDLIKTELYKPDHRFDRDTKSITVKSGELYYENGGWIQKKHVREHYKTVQQPVVYDPSADAPKFKKFLGEIFQDDEDADEKALIVLEMIGYCMLATTHLEKFFLLIGQGANGKSVLLSVIVALLGQQNVCAVQPSQMDNKFQRAHLMGMLANIITELPEGKEIHDSSLKSTVSGELTTAEHKFKSPFEFKPFCTSIFATNNMPHIRDLTDALFRRAMILTFNNKFYGTNRDPHLTEKLISELPGILNLALDALSNLLERGEFTQCKSSELAKDKWRYEADQVAQYVDECCEVGPWLSMPSSKIWDGYVKWVGDAGVSRPVNRNTLTNRLQKLGVSLVRGNGGTRTLKGICLRNSF